MNTSTSTESNWETRWISTESTFDPAYERTNAALRRWVDGMEQALLAGANVLFRIERLAPLQE